MKNNGEELSGLGDPAEDGPRAEAFHPCLKKFIRKVFQHMIADRFDSWRELAVHEQDGLAYPIYNYIIDASDAACARFLPGTVWRSKTAAFSWPICPCPPCWRKKGPSGLSSIL